MLTSHTMHAVQERKAIQHECRPYTRKVWINLAITIALILVFGLVAKLIHLHGQETPSHVSIAR